MSGSLTARQVRDLRPVHTPPRPDRPLGVIQEQERDAGGELLECATLFLAGTECPFTCVFCDLWRYTFVEPTPAGAIPAQIRLALAQLDRRPTVVKLYNASNFFDERAVPASDDPPLCRLLRPFSRTVVECHPRFVGVRACELSRRLSGRLEVALGLEVADDEILKRLGKQARLEDFRRAAGLLRDNDIDVRVFVLVGAPWVPSARQVQTVVATVREAERLGARHISLIPVRSGNGALEELARRGVFVPPAIEDLELALEACAPEVRSAVLSIDLWDLEKMARCGHCFETRRERLERYNVTGRAPLRVACDHCAGGG